MPNAIVVNLPVADLPKAKAFYEALGATISPQFNDETMACMIFSDAVQVMLLTHDRWASITTKPFPDAHVASEVMLALTCESRDAVNAMVDAAGKAGGTADVYPPKDFGFLLSRNFEDPDGHVWVSMWMDPKGMPAKA